MVYTREVIARSASDEAISSMSPAPGLLRSFQSLAMTMAGSRVFHAPVNKRSASVFPFIVRYPFDTLTVLSLSTLLKTLRISKGNVEGLPTNGDSNAFGCSKRSP